jgi:hypothetical protein
MVQEIAQEQAQFVKVFLFDCCDEDGDVAEVLVDGHPFIIVPLTNRGATVSIPVSKGKATTLSIRGRVDGRGGGVTVGVRDSMGDFFMRALREGETAYLGRVSQ